MRFSSIFQSTLPLPEMPRKEAAPETPPSTAASAPDLPDDLDARVRLVGEWQLGEA